MARSQNRIHRVRLDPVPEPVVEEAADELSSSAPGCLVLGTVLLTVLAGLGAFVTGITALVMAFRHGGMESPLYLIAAALAFGSLVYAFFKGM